MINSKAINESIFDKPKTLKEKIYSFFDDLIFYHIRRYYEKFSRVYAFARLGWDNYDFDSGYLYDVMIFKMKRLHAGLLTGYAIQEDEDMAALLEAIAICERLKDENHDDKYLDVHNEKWGAPEFDFGEKLTNADGSLTWRSSCISRKNVTVANEELERVEYLECLNKAEADRLKDIDRLAEIFKKHLPKWWD